MASGRRRIHHQLLHMGSNICTYTHFFIYIYFCPLADKSHNTNPSQSFAVYLSYYLSNDTFPEGRPLDYAFVGGLQFALAMLVAPLVTILARRLGTKPPMVFGIALQMGGFIFASFATRIWELYLSQGVLLGLGLGFIFVPSTPILSQWFSKRRSLVVGISSAGSGVGGIMFSLASQAMITHISLPWAFRITAILVGVMLLTAVLLLRDRNHIVKTTHAGFDTKLLVRSDVLLMLAWAFLSMLGYTTLLYSLPDFAKSLGLSGSRAATVNALLNLGVAVGRPMIGLVSDRLGRIKVAAAATMICGLSCFAIWIPANSYGVTIFFALFSGALVGVFWMVRSETRRKIMQ